MRMLEHSLWCNQQIHTMWIQANCKENNTHLYTKKRDNNLLRQCLLYTLKVSRRKETRKRTAHCKCMPFAAMCVSSAESVCRPHFCFGIGQKSARAQTPPMRLTDGRWVEDTSVFRIFIVRMYTQKCLFAQITITGSRVKSRQAFTRNVRPFWVAVVVLMILAMSTKECSGNIKRPRRVEFQSRSAHIFIWAQRSDLDGIDFYLIYWAVGVSKLSSLQLHCIGLVVVKTTIFCEHFTRQHSMCRCNRSVFSNHWWMSVRMQWRWRGQQNANPR